MPVNIPIIPFIGRRRVQRTPPAPLPAAPVLVAATYDVGNAYFYLTFDRPVDVSEFDGTAVVLDDQPNEGRFDGAGGDELIDPVTVRVGVNALNPLPPGPDVLLSAVAGNRIVAVDGGAEWAGVTDVELPFP